jgi:hypothetical protein
LTEAVIGDGARLDFRDDLPDTPFCRSSLTTSSSSSVKSTTFLGVGLPPPTLFDEMFDELFDEMFDEMIDTSEVLEMDLGALSVVGFGVGGLKRFGVSGFGGFGGSVFGGFSDVESDVTASGVVFTSRLVEFDFSTF